MSDLELGIVAGSSPTMVRPIPEKPASQPHGQNEPIASGLSYNDAYRALSQLPEHYRVSDGNLAGEETIKYMHLGNILYLKSKVLKHALISDAAHRGICNGQFKPLTNLSSFEEVRQDLKDYSTALQDWQHWKELAREEKAVYPIVKETQDLTKRLAILSLAKQTNDPSFLQQTEQKIAETTATTFNLFHSRENAMYQEFAEAVLTKQKNKSVFRTRFLISGSAGLALIAPMLIMTLRPSKHMALVTTSVFVIAVAVLLAWVMEDAQNKDIVAATAAYAAVLVVFVGSGSGGG